jgi:hypothetical protein
MGIKGLATPKFQECTLNCTRLPHPTMKNKQSLIYIYHIRDGYTRGCAPPLALARGGAGGGVLFFMIKQKRQNEIK